MTLKHVRDCLENGDIKGAISALDGYELRMTSARSKGGSVKSKAKSEAAKRRWERRGLESYRHVDSGPDQSIIGAEEFHRRLELKMAELKNDPLIKTELAKLPPGVMKGSEMEGRG